MDTQEISQEQQLETVELGDYIRVIRERKWIIILSVVVVLATVIAGSFLMTPKYRATSQLLYQKTNLDSALFGMAIFQSYNKEREVQTGARLVKLDAVADAVRTALGSSRSTGALLAMVSVQPEGQTDVIKVSAVSTDPKEAAEVANAFSEEFVKFRRATDQRTLAEARDLVGKQLETLDVADKGSEYALMLNEKYEELRILEAMQNGGFELVEQAGIPEAPFSPQPVRNGILALAVGLVLGTGLAFLFEYLDKRIKDEEGMEREFGLPVLAAVPALGGRWKGRSGKSAESGDLPVGFPDRTSPLLEPFRTLRSNLQYSTSTVSCGCSW